LRRHNSPSVARKTIFTLVFPLRTLRALRDRCLSVFCSRQGAKNAKQNLIILFFLRVLCVLCEIHVFQSFALAKAPRTPSKTLLFYFSSACFAFSARYMSFSLLLSLRCQDRQEILLFCFSFAYFARSARNMPFSLLLIMTGSEYCGKEAGLSAED